ncbi:MAG: S8 family serine peptidase, partial [Planctomycetota bacterium]
MTLQWDEAWGAAATDFDIELYDADINKVADSNTANIGGNARDRLNYTNTTGMTQEFRVAFRYVAGANPAGRVFKMVSFRNSDDFTENYVQNQDSIFGHNGAFRAFSIGAVPTTNPDTIEPFSSRGGVDIYFNDNGTRRTNILSRPKPSFTAADQTQTTVPGFAQFGGTSAAAPNAAASAGLILEAAGGAGSLSHNEMHVILARTAVGTGVGSWDSTHGAGRINTLGAGLVAKGQLSNEFFPELNQFGDATFEQNLSSNSDLDRIAFAQDADGVTTIRVTDSDAVFNPGAILWNNSTGDYLDIEYDTVGESPEITFPLETQQLYQVELFSESNISSAGNYTVEIDAPSPAINNLTIDEDGTGQATGAINWREDADYYRITVPMDVLEETDATISLTNLASNLDGVLTIYDEAGEVVERRNLNGAGGNETITLQNVLANTVYFARVGADDYASLGSFDLEVQFDVSSLPQVWTGPVESYVVFHNDGISHDVQDLNAFINSAGDTDSYYFAGDSTWTGEYQIYVGESNDIDPVVAVYDANTLEMIGFDDDFAPFLNIDDASLSINLDAYKKYIVVVADDDATETGDVSLTITAPQPGLVNEISINADGEGSTSVTLLENEDTDFFRFTAPDNADGNLVLTVTPSASLDAVTFLKNADGNELGRAASRGVGQQDLLNINGMIPGQEYFLSILPAEYATQGTATIELAFGVNVDPNPGDFNDDGAYTCIDVNALVGEISSGLLQIAKDNDCHMMAAQQLNRQVEGTDSKRPSLSHL